MKCRFCGSDVVDQVLNLGTCPPSNAYLEEEALSRAETYFPLRLFVCRVCFLVQVDEQEKPEQLFSSTYAYFSSVSTTWLSHCRAYAEMIEKRLGLMKDSLVVEVASNDGYLLQFFKQRGIPVLGIEPTQSTAAVARQKGIETLEGFFTLQSAAELASQGRMADLLIGDNVLAHVPDINDFVAGLALALKPAGTLTMEFPHLPGSCLNVNSILSIMSISRTFHFLS